jgi:hypothetical protein
VNIRRVIQAAGALRIGLHLGEERRASSARMLSAWLLY